MNHRLTLISAIGLLYLSIVCSQQAEAAPSRGGINTQGTTQSGAEASPSADWPEAQSAPGVQETQPAASPRLSDIVWSPNDYVHEMVIVTGYVTQHVETLSATTRFYYIKDDWGGVIKVRTSKDRPPVGRRYRISGPVTVDTRFWVGEPFISEETREEATVEPPPKPGEPLAPPRVASGTRPLEPAGTKPVSAGWWKTNWWIVLLTCIVLASLPLSAWLFYIGRSPRPAKAHTGTIKLEVPPPGTLKILPGWFEVLAGDDTLREIRFFKPKGWGKAEISLGRATGPKYRHIQLDHGTVGSRQAKLIWEGEQVRLVNYGVVNPTRIGERDPMGQEESVVLKDDDEIEMGVLKFRYHGTAGD